MLNKIKLQDLAKDLNVKPKEIVDLLAKHIEGKKTRTSTLEHEELDIVFEYYTKAFEIDDVEVYFALTSPTSKSATKEPKAEEKKEEVKKEEKQEEKKEEKKPKTPKAEKKPEEKKPEVKKEDKKPEPKSEPKQKQQREDKKPEQGKKEQPRKPQMPQMPTQKPKDKKKDKEDKPLQRRTKGEQTTVDLRSNHVNLDKYNEKYEKIAPSSARSAIEKGPSKQKITQKSKRYRKQGMRSSRRETEKERLERIAAERAKKPQMQLKLPEEITVSELAAMLKMTAAEVIKKLFTLGQMAAINDVLDYDTAAIVAEELGAKVEKLVVVTIEDKIIDDSEDDEADLEKRDPVVVVMGHVDHGKRQFVQP